MTTIAKKVGGPIVLGAITFVSGYVVLRPTEAGARKVIRSIRERGAPCATKGQVFRTTADGGDRDLEIRVGDEYKVLECAGDAVLIEVLGDPDSPYMVSSEFLRSVSDFQPDDAEPSG